MTIKQLTRVGLTESLATAYLALLQNGRLRPPELAELTNETRTNAYSLLDKLVELKLARKAAVGKKTAYEAEHPVALERFVQRQRDEALERERLAKDSLPELLNLYQLNSEKPGIRYYQGKPGIMEIYQEQLREGKHIQYIRTPADIDFFGFRFMHNLRIMAPKAGITRHMFSPDTPEVPVDWQANNERQKLSRTWLNATDYTAPVEWSVFGDKVAAISFGKEAVGIIIDSPQIAESFRQILALMDEGLKRRPGYDRMPTQAQLKNVEDFIEQYHDKSPKDKNP